jgi:hypothetical protein
MHHQGVIVPTETNTSDAPKIIYGAENIAPYIGKTGKAAFHALRSGKVPGARKIAGSWALRLDVYHASFEAA